MKKNDVLKWLSDMTQNMEAFRINRELYQLDLDNKIAVWVNGGQLESDMSDLIASITAFCKWHNIPKPKGPDAT